MVQRLFTPVQANRTLPLVRRIVGDILARGIELRRTTAGGVSDESVRRESILDLQQDIYRLVTELEQIGCSYKDWGFELGLVDFPSRIAGQRVLLCWRSDELRVEHYHRYEEGYAGRRPIPAELLDDSIEAPSDAIV